MNNSIQIFSTGGSGFVVQKIDLLDININKFKPTRGSSYIATPSALVGNHFLLNIRNNDNKCFAYSVLAALYPENKNRERQNNYKPNLHKLNLDNIEFPMPLTDVPKFEKQNNIGINVFGFEKNKILPLYLSKIKTQKIIPLQLLTDGLTSHYCLITNFHAFMARQFEKGIITCISTANVAFTDFGIQRHSKNIWIYVGSIKLFILLCQRKTQKLNLQTGIKHFQCL